MKRIWLKISVDGLLSSIAWKEANGYDFEAKALKDLITMTPEEKKTYENFLESCKVLKLRREAGYPESDK